eukprot:9588217-Heterocapsa_arctica.AAC.1
MKRFEGSGRGADTAEDQHSEAAGLAGEQHSGGAHWGSRPSGASTVGEQVQQTTNSQSSSTD